MKLLVDVNISPDICALLTTTETSVVHWSVVGDPKARDAELMAYAKEHDFVIVTHDLDFSALLAANRNARPSVIQVRFQDVLSPNYVALLRETIERFQTELKSGAIVTVDPQRAKVRVLPI
jgi:predicted nuclease of predicted toxin-antitoxin system